MSLRVRTALERVAAQRLDGTPRPPARPEVVSWDRTGAAPDPSPRPGRRRVLPLLAGAGVAALTVAVLTGLVTPLPGHRSRGAATAASGGASAAADAAVRPGPSATPTAADPDPALADHVRQRRALGLDTDPARVRAIDATGEANALPMQVAIPLSPAEREALSTRFRIQDSALSLVAQLEKRAGFAGAWFDQAHGGALHVMSTGPDFSPDVRAVVPADFPVVYERVPHPLTDLHRLESQLEAAMTGRTEEGRWLSAVGVDEPGNAVRVEVRADAPADAEARLRRAHPEPYLEITRARGDAQFAVSSATPG